LADHQLTGIAARRGGEQVRRTAVENLKQKIEAAEAAGSVRLFSMRHDFPTEWAKFISVKVEGATKTAPLTFELRPEHFPFWSQGRLQAFGRVDVLAQNAGKVEITEKPDGTGKVYRLEKDALLPGFSKGRFSNNSLELDEKMPLPYQVSLNFKQNTMDLWLAMVWGGTE